MPLRRAQRFVVAFLALALAAASASARESQAVVLGSGKDALAARASMVMKAKREINASAFIFTSDRLGQLGLAMVRQKAREGVKVRILVEPTGRTNWHPPIPRSLLVHLAEEGIEVKFYNPPRGRNLLRFWNLGHRMHDKMLEVDGEELIVGGRNLGETYFGLRPAPSTPLRKGYGNDLRPYRDLDTWLSGEAAAEAGGYFRELFAAAHVMAPVRAGVTRAAVARARASLDHYDAMLARPELSAFLRHDWKKNARPLTSARFIHDPIALGQKGPRTIDHLTRLADSAERELTIFSAYGLPSARMLGLLRRTVARGVKVKLVVNSRRSNEPLLQAAYETVAADLARAGVEIHEYQGREMLHVKVWVVDGKRAYVGSFNIDGGSERKNTETGVIVEGPELLADLGAFLGRIEAGCKRVTENGALRPDAWTRHETLTRKLIWPFLKSAAWVPGLYGRL